MYYEQRFSNERRKGNRTAVRNQELDEIFSVLTAELSNIRDISTAFADALRTRLRETAAELDLTRKTLENGHARNADLTRTRAALSKRVSRIPGRIEASVAKLSSQSIKERGIIPTEMRACVRDLVAIGAPLEGVGKIIHAVAKGLNI
ncbi:hypothetical protein B0H17DRAFT_1206506 [Mycena rosella]|uniref:Uncharacterized protein n=1 Tax=Mycena rosella TaxID=1033263 RepID=A0AAD7D8E8_MYCRO|nr:hypothetical protein B0H17DRAFT_1206506 [Mycena rosella]